jgi:2'-5' RNA ligase
MPTADDAHAGSVRNHWWWRPGWRAGRHFYACHLTLEAQPELRDLIGDYQDALGQFANLDLIPPRWLHLTMQGIGFVDEISLADLAAVTKRITDRLRDVPAPTVTFDRPIVEQEAVLLKAHPAEPIYELRLATYQAIASALGAGRLPEAQPRPEQYRPHVSAAYVNSDGPAQPIIDALSKIREPAVTVTFRTASILTFHRDDQMYEWTNAVPIPIGHDARHHTDRTGHRIGPVELLQLSSQLQGRALRARRARPAWPGSDAGTRAHREELREAMPGRTGSRAARRLWGRRPAAPLRAGALRARRRRQVSTPTPAGRQSRRNAPDDRAAGTDRAVLLAPDILSPRKDHCLGRAQGRVPAGWRKRHPRH